MKRRYWLCITVAIPCCVLAAAACERLPNPKPAAVKETKETIKETIETVELSMETLIDRMVTQGKSEVEQAQQKGHKNTVGLADGKWWSETSDLARVMYVRSLGDFASALSNVSLAAFSEVSDRETTKGLKSDFFGGVPSYSASAQAESCLSGRISSVMAGHSFGDISQAVTNFYRNKPLLKDRPVIWVLAVPLFKEYQEASPKEKRTTAYDSVVFNMRREVKER